jgi:hypothetical protein
VDRLTAKPEDKKKGTKRSASKGKSPKGKKAAAGKSKSPKAASKSPKGGDKEAVKLGETV